uniref:(northern house mosquito) hypothetical protein n=1 Tax=Culex pipiens TaxID=7175 RepID=A0A8D8FBZ3_CULPI
MFEYYLSKLSKSTARDSGNSRDLKNILPVSLGITLNARVKTKDLDFSFKDQKSFTQPIVSYHDSQALASDWSDRFTQLFKCFVNRMAYSARRPRLTLKSMLRE